MALQYDALFLRRHGFDAVAEPLESDFAEDAGLCSQSLADDGRGAAGGHVVAHSQGAISAMMAAVERPDLVYSLTLVEPACLSLTAELPATAAHRALMQPLFEVRHQLGDDDFQREFFRRAFAADTPGADVPRRRNARPGASGCRHRPGKRRCRSCPGVPTLVLTGGWEPLYEEIAGYLRETGALHRIAAGGHRPQDSPKATGPSGRSSPRSAGGSSPGISKDTGPDKNGVLINLQGLSGWPPMPAGQAQ